MTPERQAYANEWADRIREKVFAPLGTVAVFAAEQVSKIVSFDNNYPDEDYED